jgi:hypothetical protein
MTDSSVTSLESTRVAVESIKLNISCIGNVIGLATAAGHLSCENIRGIKDGIDKIQLELLNIAEGSLSEDTVNVVNNRIDNIHNTLRGVGANHSTIKWDIRDVYNALDRIKMQMSHKKVP